MRRVVILIVVAMLAAPTYAFQPHPLRAWVQANPQAVDKRAVDEKVARSQARRKAIKGAVVGGLAAGLRAAILRQDIAKATAVGAAAGALAGYIMGKMEDRQLADRGELEQRVGYISSEGFRAEVTNVSCNPCQVKPGEPFSLTVSYWVLAPERNELALSRYLGLAVEGTYIKGYTFDPDPFRISNGGGEFETTFTYTIKDEGTYTVEWLVENDDVQQAKSTEIIVSSAV
ncbi:MAG TPA: hypothetical protein VEK57_00300 [Thermoanaerobaculia bacterium]|nr:hypothetical protein [Thermoanaerobaculia bacterium]